MAGAGGARSPLPRLMGTLTRAGSHCGVLTEERATLRFALWNDPTGLRCRQEWEVGQGGMTREIGVDSRQNTLLFPDVPAELQGWAWHLVHLELPGGGGHRSPVSAATGHQFKGQRAP